MKTNEISLSWRKITTVLFAVVLMMNNSCTLQESVEEKAERDAKEYTHKYCPTPFINSSRTDSVVFDKTKRVYTNYCTFDSILDDEEIIDANRDKLTEILQQSLRENTSLRQYVQAGFSFQYVCRSNKDPQKILFQVKF